MPPATPPADGKKDDKKGADGKKGAKPPGKGGIADKFAKKDAEKPKKDDRKSKGAAAEKGGKKDDKGKKGKKGKEDKKGPHLEQLPMQKKHDDCCSGVTLPVYNDPAFRRKMRKMIEEFQE